MTDTDALYDVRERTGNPTHASVDDVCELVLERAANQRTDHHTENASRLVSFQFEFPQATATLRTTVDGSKTEHNPIVGVLRDAVDRLPDRAIAPPYEPATADEEFTTKLNSIEKLMSDQAYGPALDEMGDFRVLVSDAVKAEYDALANHPTREKFLALVDRMAARLETLLEVAQSG